MSQTPTHSLHCLLLHILESFPHLPFALHFLKKSNHKLPLVVRMDVGEVGGQVNVKFFKLFQRNWPLPVIPRKYTMVENPWDDPLDQGLFQQFVGHWVQLVPILTLYKAQDKHTQKGGHALPGQSPPNLLLLFMHASRMTVHWRQLFTHSPPQIVSSTHIHSTG